MASLSGALQWRLSGSGRGATGDLFAYVAKGTGRPAARGTLAYDLVLLQSEFWGIAHFRALAEYFMRHLFQLGDHGVAFSRQPNRRVIDAGLF